MASTVPPQELALVVDISLSMTEHLKLVKVRDAGGGLVKNIKIDK